MCVDETCLAKAALSENCDTVPDDKCAAGKDIDNDFYCIEMSISHLNHCETTYKTA